MRPFHSRRDRRSGRDRAGWGEGILSDHRQVVAGFDLLRLPPIAAELPDEFEQSFLIGKPWFFGEHEFLTEQCILS